MVAKASLCAKLILKCFPSRDPKLLTKAFCVFVRPILEYASVIWNPHYKNQITKIERLHFNSHFQGEPVFIEAKDDGGGGDNWTTGATSRAKFQSNHHHQQTNIQFFTDRMPFLSPNQQCQSTIIISVC